MKTLKISILSLSLMAFVLLISSCSKDGNNNSPEGPTSATDYTALLGIMDLSDTEEATGESITKSYVESSYLPCFEVTRHENENGESDIVIDYGDGECDNIATMTQDGESTEITLGFTH